MQILPDFWSGLYELQRVSAEDISTIARVFRERWHIRRKTLRDLEPLEEPFSEPLAGLQQFLFRAGLEWRFDGLAIFFSVCRRKAAATEHCHEYSVRKVWKAHFKRDS